MKPVDFLVNIHMQRKVKTQLYNRRTPRVIARSLGITENAVWEFLAREIGRKAA